ncbi:sensor histidine kinase [Actinocrinis sp.]|uniref:sensor histidine kinase n=1 Tax=Actinocrinis sp. TaxID=1920516 RepID=UPI002D2DD6F9|nr:histidine kinase [Actinocrinis sp.]HZP54831.1 histidine kinase [Actinocrinis sp.]
MTTADFTRIAGGLRRRAAAAFAPSRELPTPSRRAWIFDLALAFVLTAITLISVSRENHGLIATPGFGPDGTVYPLVRPAGTSPAELLLAGMAAAPLAARRRYPMSVFWIMFFAIVNTERTPAVLFVTIVIAAYSSVAYSPYRVPAIGGLMLAAVIVAARSGNAIPQIPNSLSPFVILVPVAYAGNTIRRWRQQTAANLARIRALELGQEEATREAVELERARIARELHDVVTHNVSVMVVQAGAARKVMGSSPEQATQALLAVEASGRTAMAELRQVMGLLTTAAEEPQDAAPGAPPSSAGSGAAFGVGRDARFAPQPDLDQLESLVDRVRAIGVPVTLTFTGPVRPLPPGVGLAAYRVVQEALTNTVKHAVGASAAVTVTYGEMDLRLEIVDTGGIPSEAAATGNRRGLLGLRERLAVYGGRLETARRPTGGFRVTAVIPLEAQ